MNAIIFGVSEKDADLGFINRMCLLSLALKTHVVLICIDSLSEPVLSMTQTLDEGASKTWEAIMALDGPWRSGLVNPVMIPHGDYGVILGV